MKEMSIVFTKSKLKFPIGSLLIRWWMSTDYSHCARKIPVYDTYLYYQASEGRVNYESEEVFAQKHEVLLDYKIMLNDEDFNNIGRECVKNAGIKYGFMQNVGIVYVWLMDKLGKQIKNPWKKGKNCSELLLPVLQKIFPNKFHNLDPNTVTPKDLQIRLQELKEEELIH
jgi:hypothetical protein